MSEDVETTHVRSSPHGSRFRRLRAVGVVGQVHPPAIDHAPAVRHDAQTSVGALPFSTVGAGDADVSVRGVTVPGPRSGVVDPRGHHEVLWIGDGSAQLVDEHGATLTAQVGHPVILSASIGYRFTADAHKMTIVYVSDALIRQIAAERALTLHGPVVFEQQDDLVAALAPFRTLIREVGPVITDPGVTGAARSALDRRVAAAVLDAFPLRDPHGGASHRFRDAIAFVHDTIGSAPTTAGIAEAAGLSERGVQQMFRRVLGTTPMQYVRRVRLDRVRGALLAAGPEDTTVADVARRNGVGHLGRFSADYRHQFGENPYATLRRPPSPPHA